METPLTEPLSSPVAWRNSDLNDESWTITLTPEQLEELDAVITPHVVG
ncbi:uncharacterized protein METZ01_LOCUS415590, partial [marine metagenome]